MNGNTSGVGGMQGYDQYRHYGNASMNASTSRVVTPMQGLQAPLPGMTDDDYEAYKMAYAYGDPDATMDGIGKWWKRVTAGGRKRRAARQERRAERKDQRSRRREARTQRAEKGERFVDRVGQTLRDFGQAKISQMEALKSLEDEGIMTDPGGLRDMLVDFGGDVGADAMKKTAKEWFDENKKWAIPVGAAILIGGGYAIYRASNKKKRRRRR